VFRYAVGLLALVGALASCSLGRSVQEEAADQLRERFDGVHEHYLHERSLHPTSTGAEALQQLDRYGDALRAETDGDRIFLMTTIDARVHRGGGFFYEDATVAACVGIAIRAGSGGSDRGSVLTAPVPCPTDADLPANSDQPVDLEARFDHVGEPPPPRSVCISGEVCTEGGG
jgi:hypothetical protein